MDFRILKAHDYGIVNPLQTDIRALGLDRYCVSLAPQALAQSAEKLPSLVAFSELPKQLTGDLLEQLTAQKQDKEPLIFSAFLRTIAGKAQLVSHLKKQFVLRDGNGKRMLFRFYDPHVFMHLQWILPAAQLSAVLGPVQQWTYHLNGERAEVHGGTAPVGHWSPNAEQYQKIARIGLINRVLAKSKKSQTNDQAANSEEVDRWLQRGVKHGLARRDDLVAFALQGLSQHPAFDQHAKIRSLLDAAREGTRPYHSASKSLDALAWQQIADELDSPEEPRYASQ